VTAYFGEGSFSYDADGRFVVVQGYGWLWKEDQRKEATDNYEEDQEFAISLYDSGLPWAYVAILNSSIFEVLLSAFCPRVQGGQFNLSDRFVKRIYVPDLSDENAAVADDVKELESFGRALIMDQPVDLERVDLAVARIYGVPLSEWVLT
jgi:hypothetical protein